MLLRESCGCVRCRSQMVVLVVVVVVFVAVVGSPYPPPLGRWLGALLPSVPLFPATRQAGRRAGQAAGGG